MTVAGAGLFGGSGGRANVSVELLPKGERNRSAQDIIQEVRRVGRQIPGATVVARPAGTLPGGAGSGRLDVEVSGPDLDTLTEVVSQVKAAASQVPGLVDLEDTGARGTPELHIVLDRARMAQLNVSSQQAIDALRTTLGGRVVSVLRPTGKTQQDITVIASDVDRKNLTNLAAIPVRGGATLNTTSIAASQPIVTLGQIASISYGTGPVQIQRVNRNRTISVTGTAVGRSLGDVAADLRQAVARVAMPAGYSARPGRQVNQFNDALMALGQALALAVVLEYMLLVALYGSWFYPLVLMLSVPLGLVGSIFGLALTGNTINIFSLIGLIMAFGLVAKNGILLIDYANILRERGLERTEALAEAARTRLRPILMTSATMTFGMFPLALKIEAGAESRAPMAVAVIGAILTSTALAVVVLPAVYTLFDDLQVALARHPAPAFPSPAAVPSSIPALAAGPFGNHRNGRRRGAASYARRFLATRERRGAHGQSAGSMPSAKPASPLGEGPA